MLLDFIDRKIRSAFSNAALEYDLLTSLHKEIGRELLKKVMDTPCNDRVLDIGAGTAWLTKKIKFYLPESTVVGIDFAEGMLKAAKEEEADLSLVLANATQLPFKSQSQDLIVSNLSLQWVKPLEQCFRCAVDCLHPQGKFIFTMFGRATFNELFASLDQAQRELKGSPFKIERLPSLEEVRDSLKAAGFVNIQLDYELIKVHFSDMMRLVKWIKDIGANALPRQVFVGKQLLNAANEHYEKNFKDKFGIVATFEVIWASADK